MCIGKAVQGTSDPLNLFHKSDNSVADNLFDPMKIGDSMNPKTTETKSTTTSTSSESSTDTLSAKLDSRRKKNVLSSASGSDNVLATASQSYV